MLRQPQLDLIKAFNSFLSQTIPWVVPICINAQPPLFLQILHFFSASLLIAVLLYVFNRCLYSFNGKYLKIPTDHSPHHIFTDFHYCFCTLFFLSLVFINRSTSLALKLFHPGSPYLQRFNTIQPNCMFKFFLKQFWILSLLHLSKVNIPPTLLCILIYRGSVKPLLCVFNSFLKIKIFFTHFSHVASIDKSAFVPTIKINIAQKRLIHTMF